MMTIYDLNRGVQPLRGFGAGTFTQAAATLVLAAVATGFPVLAHFSGQTVALGATVALGMLIANFATAAVPAVLIFSFVFQNFFVALVSPHIQTLSDFNAIRAYNFILTVSVWTVVAVHYLTSRRSFDGQFRKLMDLSFAALGVVGLYLVLGLASNPKGAAVYFRNIATPFMLLQCFAFVGYRSRAALQATLAAVAWLLLAYGYAEALEQHRLFELTNSATYLDLGTRLTDPGAWLRELHETGRVMRSYFDVLEADFLNTPLLGDLGIKVHRLLGPNFHAISYAYSLAFFSLLLIGTGNWFYALAAAPLLVLVGSKGSLVLEVATIGGLVISRYVRSRAFLWFYIAALLAWAAILLVIGLRAGDYHVIGFFGGINGFVHNPLGHGLGAGGNIRLDSTTQIDWSRAQHLGETDIAVESAIGVMLYQMGIGTFAVLLFVLWVVWQVWTLYKRTGDRLSGIAALALITILVNGIFQEEALFAPLALGTMMGLAGLLLGRSYRGQAPP